MIEGMRHPATDMMPRFVQVGACVVDRLAMVVHAPTGEAKLSPKTRDVFLCLVSEPGKPVSREDILSRVWSNSFPSDEVVTKAIKELRQSFGDSSHGGRAYIETLSKVGYILVAPILPVAEDWRPPREQSMLTDDNPSQVESDEISADDDEIVNTSTPGVTQICSNEPKPTSPRPLTVPRFAPQLAFALVIALAAAWIASKRENVAPPDLSSSLRESISERARPFATNIGLESGPAVSPDGNWVAYQLTQAGRTTTSIWLRALDGSGARPLHPDFRGDEYGIAWSPDNHHIAFARKNGLECKLIYAEIISGSEREIADCLTDVLQIKSFTPDGSAILQVDRDPDAQTFSLYLISLSDGIKRRFSYPRVPGASDLGAQYSPDGKTLVLQRYTSNSTDLYLLAADGSGSVRRLTRLQARIYGFAWLDSQRIVFSSKYSGRQELSVIDVRTGEVIIAGAVGATYPSTDLKGRVLAYQVTDEDTSLMEVSLTDPKAAPRALFRSSRGESFPSREPGGLGIAFVSTRDGEPKIYRSSNPDGLPVLLGAEPMIDIGMTRYSADGSRILFGGRKRDGTLGLYSVDVKSHHLRRETEEPVSGSFGALAKDGTLYYDSIEGGSTQVKARAADGSEWLVVKDATDPRLSPDGQWLYFLRLSPGSGLFRVAALGASEPQLVVPEISSWNWGGWDISDDFVFFHHSGDSFLRAIYKRRVDGKGLGLPVLVRPIETDDRFYGLSVSPDQTSAIYAQHVAESTDIFVVRF